MSFRVVLLILSLILATACTKSSDPANSNSKNGSSGATGTQNPVNYGIPSANADPALVEIYKQANKVKQRLRFYGEEIKTTFKPETQAGLFADVHKVILPVWQEINQVITTKSVTNSSAIRIEKACATLNKIFEFGSTKANVQSVDFEEHKVALQEFNDAFAELERAVGIEKKPEKEKNKK